MSLLASIMGTRFKTARSKSSFIITPRALARPGFIPIGKFRQHTFPLSMSQLNDGRGLPKRYRALAFRVVALGRRAEGSFDCWVVVEKREENGDAFDDGSAQFRLDAPPVVVEPTLDGLELFQPVGVGLIESCFAQALEINGFALQGIASLRECLWPGTSRSVRRGRNRRVSGRRSGFGSPSADTSRKYRSSSRLSAS